MNDQNGSAKFPPQRVARNVGAVAHDVFTLAELQAELLKLEASEFLRCLLMPAAMLLFALIVLAGCVPVLLGTVAWMLVAQGAPQWLAYMISATLGLGVAGLSGTFGWRKLRQLPLALSRSREELKTNLLLVKHLLAK